jgi:hypothetical protein
LDTYFAPSVTAVLTAADRSDRKLLVASTSRRWQLGQAADTMSRSSEISPAQPALGGGYGPGRPAWFTLLKQPFAVLHSGRPNCAR